MMLYLLLNLLLFIITNIRPILASLLHYFYPGLGFLLVGKIRLGILYHILFQFILWGDPSSRFIPLLRYGSILFTLVKYVYIHVDNRIVNIEEIDPIEEDVEEDIEEEEEVYDLPSSEDLSLITPPTIDSIKRGEISQKQRENYLLYKKDLNQKNFIDIPSGYLFMYIQDILCSNLAKDPGKARSILIRLQHAYSSKEDFVQIVSHSIGDLCLLLGEREKAISWYQLVDHNLLNNIVISYYNYEQGLEKMPLFYWRRLYQGARGEESLKELLLYLNKRMKKDTERTLLDFLLLKEKGQMSYILFAGIVRDRERKIIIEPYQNFLAHKKTRKILSTINKYYQKNHLQRILKDTRIPKRLRNYISHYMEQEEKRDTREKDSVKKKREEAVKRVRPPKKKRIIHLNEERIKKALDEQRETATYINSLFSVDREEERPTPRERETQQTLQGLEDIFQRPQIDTLPELDQEEKEILMAFLEKRQVKQRELHHLLRPGTFPNQSIDLLNNKLYDYLGETIIEKEDSCWSLKEEYIDTLEEMVLSQ